MTKLILAFILLFTIAPLKAGEPYTFVDKTSTSPSFYGDNEKTITIFGDYKHRHEVHAWGGTAEGQYFLNKHIAIGLSGSIAEKSVYTGVVTGTLRVPLKESRFAPYGFVGAGAIHDKDAKFLSQAGIGLEYRFTPKVGWKTDYSLNFSDGDHFGMARTGINFAF